MLRTRRVVSTATAALAFVGSLVLTSAETGAHATTVPTRHIQANNFYFCAYSKTMCDQSDAGHVTKIRVGTRVVWNYKDTACDAIALCPGHDVKVRTWTTSPTVKTEGAVIYKHIFRRVGIFHYVCTHHKNTGMTGTIKVVSGS